MKFFSFTLVVICCLTSGISIAQNPDVIVGDLPATNSYGTSPGTDIYAYSVATTSCNIGDANLDWIDNNNRHPVIAQDMFKLHEGRFTQIGSSWLKHGFCALQISGLCTGCGGGGGCLSFLTPGCSDPYSAGLNGSQGNLGPRSQVNAFTGFFPFPYSAPNCPPSESTICRRLQVHVDDLTNSLNPGALYFVSGQYVALDDSDAGNQANNASYRRVSVSQSGNRSLSFIGGTQMMAPPIQAWQDFQPSVTLVDLQVPNEGLFIAGYDVIDNGNGTWNYEYAVYNMYSDRSANSFFVPVPAGATVTNVGFKDITWHSEEPYSGVDWTVNTQNGVGITWSAQDFNANPNANAIRWSMLFNFHFTCDAPPADNQLTLGLFKPGNIGDPNSLDFTAAAPSGNFIPSVQNLTCNSGSMVNPVVNLNWTNGDTYDSISIFRDGVFAATIGGSETSFTDNSAFGTTTYTVQGAQGSVNTAAVPCESTITPMPQSNLSCVQPDPDSQDVSLSWTNGMTYDSIRITRDGAEIAVINGSLMMYDDPGLALGAYTYSIEGSNAGVSAGVLECAVTVLAPPPLGYTVFANDASGTYDPSTGAGSTSMVITGIEATGNTGYPNAVSGYSLALSFDSALLASTGIDPNVIGTPVDFFDGQLGDGVVTIGCVVSFLGTNTITLENESGLAEINFDTVAGSFVGSTAPVTTDIVFANGVSAGSLPVDNLIVVNSVPMQPTFDNGVMTLTAGGGGFVRGDINGDSAINIADAVNGLNYLFNGNPVSCVDAVDTNDDGSANVADGVYLLAFLFSGGSAPPPPNTCGGDPTSDSLTCDSFPACP
ncbi:MAG: hypothetical protein CBC13_03350 [Planctomycetia bacterium TMED53]|nr:MAG: hypothetical protein CBC13_03350 [Planctomycetia bacterium TMED53]